MIDLHKIIIYCETGIEAAESKRVNKAQGKSTEQVMLERILEIANASLPETKTS